MREWLDGLTGAQMVAILGLAWLAVALLFCAAVSLIWIIVSLRFTALGVLLG